MASRRGKASRGVGVLLSMSPGEGAGQEGSDALTSVARPEAVAAFHEYGLHPGLATAAGELPTHDLRARNGEKRGFPRLARSKRDVAAVRTLGAGPGLGLLAQVLLLAAIARSVGLDGLGWVVGLTCGLIVNGSLTCGLSRYGSAGMRPADWVTLARASLAVGVAALVGESFDRRAPVALLVSLAGLALVLDAVDGWVARRTRATAALGARFDAEVDAFLILTLSVYVSRTAGAWVLAIGAARYVFLAAGWLAPWMRAQLPPRFWRKTVAATEGIVLTVAATNLLSRTVTQALLFVALALLAESFGRDVWWLWHNRDATPQDAIPPVTAEPAPALPPAPAARPGRERAPTAIAAALTILAVLLLWADLVAPDQPSGLTPAAFLRVPLEGLVLITLAVVLPVIPRRILAGLVGPILGLVVIVKLLDVAFVTFMLRPFDPVGDLGNISTGVETMRATLGETKANLLIAGGVTLAVVLVVATTLASLRLMRLAAGHRRWSLRAVAALGAVWLLCSASGAQLLSHTSIASTSTASFVVHEVRTVQADLRDSALFAKQIRHDPFRNTPGNQLLTALRGKDVLLVFVESYGQVSVQGSSFSPSIDALLTKGTKQLATAGFAARSAFVNAPGFGGASWLGHSTLQSGAWVNSQRRYNLLVGTSRFNLTEAFNRAGWRTINFAPADDRDWPEGSSFYHYDKLYDRREMGYRGPTFSYPPMPDQYMFAELQRLELSRTHRRALFAEVDTVSSHMPWTHIPQQIPWDELGNGSIFNRIPMYLEPDSFWWHPNQVKLAYARSLQYSLNVLISFVRHYGKRNLVLIVVGDEQPLPIVSGHIASHDVPISLIARDPALMKRIAGWGWQTGLLPRPQAPVWRMDAFRDRFLTAYGSRPTPG